LYEGVPLTGRSRYYGMVPPDKITIFRGTILRVCPPGDEDAIRAQVRRTVLHEVAHHFGIDDDRLHEIGAY
jgi:predicted Zn-dependent protease with MMP-like domain